MKQLIETETFELLLSDNSKTATDNLIKEIIRSGEPKQTLLHCIVLSITLDSI